MRSQERKRLTRRPNNLHLQCCFFLLMQHAKARPCHLSHSGTCLQSDPVPSCGCPSCFPHLFLANSSYAHQQTFSRGPVLKKGGGGGERHDISSLVPLVLLALYKWRAAFKVPRRLGNHSQSFSSTNPPRFGLWVSTLVLKCN